MQITSTTSSTTGAQTGSKSTSSAQQMGRDQFLKLLCTQLQNQDPMKPMESYEFSAQLAQFSSVEQLMDIKSLLTSSTETNQILTETVYNSLASNLIGKEIKASSSNLRFDGTNSVKFGFEYPKEAKTLKISITDSSGKVVKTFEKSWSLGENTIVWDGKDLDGNMVGSGDYKIIMDAKDPDGNAVSITPFTTGKISAIRYKSGESFVVVNGVEINFKNLTEIFGGS